MSKMSSVLKVGLLLTIGSCCLVNGAFPVSLGHLSSPGDALTALRKLAPSEPLQDRCTRMTALLVQLQKTNSIDLLTISRIGQDQVNNLNKLIKSVNTSNAIAKLLFSGLDSYIEDAELDKAYLDLIDCIRFTFQGSSMQVIRDLAADRYIIPAQQLRSILSQQANLFADPQFRHPTLKLDDLDAPVRRTISSWFKNDEQLIYNHFVSQEKHHVDVLSGKIDEVFDAMAHAFNEVMNGRWKANNKCQVYTDFVKYGLGKIERRQAELTLKNLQTRIANTQKVPIWTPNSEDAKEVIQIVRAAAQAKAYDPVLLEVIDCLALVFNNQPAAVDFLNSEEMTRLIDEMESSFQEESPVAQPVENVASAAEPDDQDHPDEPDDSSDDEEDSDDDDSDDEDEEEEEDGDGQGEEGGEEGEEAVDDGEQEAEQEGDEEAEPEGEDDGKAQEADDGHDNEAQKDDHEVEQTPVQEPTTEDKVDEVKEEAKKDDA